MLVKNARYATMVSVARWRCDESAQMREESLKTSDTPAYPSTKATAAAAQAPA
mgnify:FL=1